MCIRNRIPRGIPILATMLLVLCVPPVRAQEKKTSIRPLCPHCDTTGKVPNPFMEELSAGLGGIELASWVVEEDTRARGLAWIPCPKCRNPELKARAEAEFARLVKARTDWLAERRAIDEKLEVKKPLLHVKTAHFVWASSLPKMKVGRKSLNPRALLVHFARGLEDFHARFLTTHRVEDKDFLYPFHRLYVFHKQGTGRKATGEYARQYSLSGRMTLPGHGSSLVTWWDKSRAPSSEDLFREIVHNATHLMTASYRNGGWSYYQGVAYEGLAHWWEFEITGKATAYCQDERDMMHGWVSEGWGDRVKKLVVRDKTPPLAELITVNGGSLDMQGHMVGWSLMECMMAEDSRKTLDFIARLKATKNPGQSFLDAWGRSLLAFEERWKEYVKNRPRK